MVNAPNRCAACDFGFALSFVSSPPCVRVVLGFQGRGERCGEDLRVAGSDSKVAAQRLSDNHSIDRVAVIPRQSPGEDRIVGIDGKVIDALSVAGASRWPSPTVGSFEKRTLQPARACSTRWNCRPTNGCCVQHPTPHELLDDFIHEARREAPLRSETHRTKARWITETVSDRTHRDGRLTNQITAPPLTPITWPVT